MRLADFILGNIEPILMEWEKFARKIWPGAAVDPTTLRDHAAGILRAAAEDMKSRQTPKEQSDKSKGDGQAGDHSEDVDEAAKQHGSDREEDGFHLGALVAEYRALRASVMQLWQASAHNPEVRDLEDVSRFNESIDQSLAEAVESFMQQVEGERESMIKEQAAREGAENANRAKDTFLAVLSHELRTPLNAIVGWVSILRSQKCTDIDLEEALDVIQRNTDAQVRIISDIQDVSRIVSGKMTVDLRACDLVAVVGAGVDATRAAAEARGVALDVDLHPSARHAACDATRMQQVVWNLVSNAIKFTPKGGQVSIKLLRYRSDTHLEVSDNGEGIDPEFMPFLFDRFRQADGSSRRQVGGLGLGLSIVKHLVEAHGGTIEARSAGVGKGATFVVVLPVPSVAVDEDEDAPEIGAGSNGDPGETHFPPVRLDGLRVLVVDDEPDARRLLVRVLEAVGATATATGSAAEALETLATFRPEVLVSDIGMPGEDGFDLIRQVRSRGHHPRDLPAVALTAFVQKDDHRRALLAGFQVHVSKPVDPHDLTVVIASLAGRTGQLAESEGDISNSHRPRRHPVIR